MKPARIGEHMDGLKKSPAHVPAKRDERLSLSCMGCTTDSPELQEYAERLPMFTVCLVLRVELF